MAFNPTVDEEKCVGCEECVDVCPVEVFEMRDGKSVPANAEECLGPALEPYRKDVFLACKTGERTAEGSERELHERVQVIRNSK